MKITNVTTVRGRMHLVETDSKADSLFIRFTSDTWAIKTEVLNWIIPDNETISRMEEEFQATQKGQEDDCFLNLQLDRRDLISLVKGTSPSYRIFSHPLLEKAGHRHRDAYGTNNWYNLKDLSDSELFELYQILKQSSN